MEPPTFGDEEEMEKEMHWKEKEEKERGPGERKVVER